MLCLHYLYEFVNDLQVVFANPFAFLFEKADKIKF